MKRLAIIGFASLTAIGCSTSSPQSQNKWETISSSPTTANATEPVKAKEPMQKGKFMANLPQGFAAPTDDAGRKLLNEYGAVFVTKATPPKVVFFKDEAAVSEFQSAAGSSTETIGGHSITLQKQAMDALKKAIDEASKAGVSITPRGSDAAKRSYSDTVGLWKSRVDPGLEHWQGKGKLSVADAARIKALSPSQQIPEIFKLEAEGMFFAKDLSKSIIYSVAPPGSSQHLSMLALDVVENGDEKIRSILAKNGWYQTVVSDLPHFTFIGANESDLPGLGLKKMSNSGRTFWVPDL